MEAYMAIHTHKQFAAYLRVSTDKQGRSGLGLEAQRELIHMSPDVRNCRKEFGAIEEFVEVESGKNCQRPKLQEALAYCKKHNATLVIAKLDRLGRNLHFISGLMESGVDFMCCDNPHANKLMLHLLAAFAEHEREMISERTKAALKIAKAKGVELGKHGKILAYRNKKEAKYRAEQLRPIIEKIAKRGCVTTRAIANELNRRNIPATSDSWNAGSVSRLLKKIDVNPALIV